MSTLLLSNGAGTGRREHRPDRRTAAYRLETLGCMVFHGLHWTVPTVRAGCTGALACVFSAGIVSCWNGCGKEFELFGVGE